MDIYVGYSAGKAREVLEFAKEMFDDVCDSDIKWLESSVSIKADVNISGKRVADVFEKIIEVYPEASLSASAIYNCREGDGSADWWTTETVEKVKKADGTYKIVVSQSTDWN